MTKDPLYKIEEMNWRDNKKFPKKLERERLRDKENNPETYEHVWEGGFLSAVAGAYYSKFLQKAKEDGRISVVAEDPLMTVRAFLDIGGTGAKADAVAIWIAQFVGKQIRVLDYYESAGQPLATHVNWLRDNGYEKASIWLPHDGDTNDKVHDVSYHSYLKAAGFPVVVVKNQGKGAAMGRIESSRRTFPSVWFNADTTEDGRMSLGYYHEKIDETRGIGLGPSHDWSSHASDAYGLMAIVYEKHDKDSSIGRSKDPYGGFRAHG